MPQTFQVLRCYKCLVFQIHQTIKSNKFECKLCGEKQSIKRHYGLGTGKECRLHVQKLNLMRGNMDDSNNSLSNDDDDDDIQNADQAEEQDEVKTEKESKWSEYIDKTEEDTNESVKNMYLDNTEVVLEIPSKRRKFTRNKNTASDKCKRNNEDLERDSIEDFIIERNSNALQTGMISTSKQTARQKFVPPTCNKMSKWAHFVEENNCNEDFHSDEELEIPYVESKQFLNKPNNKEMCNTQGNKTVNNFRSDKHKMLCQSNPIAFIKNTTNNQSQNLFSLCNDNDLDKILDI